MRYKEIEKGIFLSRENRFVARVLTERGEERVHVKNTGRLKELLVPGREIILSKAQVPGKGSAPARKTAYDLIAVRKPGLGLVNIDSQAPNKVVAKWLQGKNFDLVRAEYTFLSSRFDFYLENQGQKMLMEVKGCTLEVDGMGYFPDAPTTRGTRHVLELAKAAGMGYLCTIVFVIQMPRITQVLANGKTDPAFAAAIEKARAAGVRILNLPCAISEDEIKALPSEELVFEGKGNESRP